MRGEEHQAFAGGGQACSQRGASHRVQPTLNLVEEQNLRRPHERASEREPSAYAGRQGLDREVKGGLEPALCGHTVHVVHRRILKRAGERQVRPRSQSAVKSAIVRHAPPHSTADTDAAARWAQNASGGPQQGRLACPIRTQDGDALTRMQPQVDAIEHAPRGAGEPQTREVDEPRPREDIQPDVAELKEGRCGHRGEPTKVSAGRLRCAMRAASVTPLWTGQSTSSLPRFDETYWDPHISRRNLADLVWRDPGLAELLEGLAGQRIVAGFADESAHRIFELVDAKPAPRGIRLWLKWDEAASRVRNVKVGLPVVCSWVMPEGWMASQGEVAALQRGVVMVDVSPNAWVYPWLERPFEDIMGAGQLFRGFDPTLTDATDLHATTHGARIQETLQVLGDQRRPLLAFFHDIGVFFAGRFVAPDEKNVVAFDRRRDIELKLTSVDGEALYWRPGQAVTVSSVAAGQTFSLRSRVTEGNGDVVFLERPDMLYRWDRRQQPRVLVGHRADVECHVPTQEPGAGVAYARSAGVVDLSVGGACVLLDASARDTFAVDVAPLLLLLPGQTRIRIAAELISSEPTTQGLYQVSLAFKEVTAETRVVLQRALGALGTADTQA